MMLLKRPMPGEGCARFGSSISGSMRQNPLLASPYHRWRSGLPVNLLMAVPGRIRPEAGKVTDDRPAVAKPSVPAQSVVVVGTLSTVTFCAFAEAANAQRTARHQSASCRETGRSRTASRRNVVVFELLITKVFLLSGWPFSGWPDLVIPRKSGSVINRPCVANTKGLFLGASMLSRLR